MIQMVDEQDVRRICREELQRPVVVSQRSIEAVVGLPRRDYLRLARSGAWPTTRERRLVLSRTADVLAWLEHRLSHRDIKPANDASAESLALSRVGARRVG